MPTNKPVVVTVKVADALKSHEEIGILAEEMEEWMNSIPDSLTGSSKYEAVEEAANLLNEEAYVIEEAVGGLEDILNRSENKDILNKEITFTKRVMYKGYAEPRWVRLHNAVAALTAVSSFIERSPLGSTDEIIDLLTSLNDSLSNLESVDFPSMYG